MPCPEHSSRKKGDCISCGGCKLCPPIFRKCNEKNNHNTNTKRGRPTNEDVTSRKKSNKQLGESLVKNRKTEYRKSFKAANIKLKNTLDYGSDVDATTCPSVTAQMETALLLDALTPNSFNSFESVKERNANAEALKNNREFPVKHKVLKLLLLLGIPFDTVSERFPTDGFNQESFIDPTTMYSRKARNFRYKIIQKIDELLCPGNPDVWCTLLDPMAVIKQAAEEKHEKDITKLALEGHTAVSITASCIMANTYNFSTLQNIYHQHHLLNMTIPRTRYEVCEKRYTRLRKLYKVLASGKEIPKRQGYTYRVDPDNMRSALTYLQTALQVRPGALRSIKYCNYTFKGLPVYTRGGISKRNLHEAYKLSMVDEGKYLGRHTFGDLTNLLTSRGIEKTGLSTYYVRLKYIGQIYEGMIKRIQEIDTIASRKGILCIDLSTTNIEEHIPTIKDDCALLEQNWQNVWQFLAFKFSEVHLQIDSTCPVLCCRFGVNTIDTCDHDHDSNEQCKLSMEALQVFDPFIKLLRYIDIDNYTYDIDNEMKLEIKSMIKTPPIMKTQVKNYMSHRLRAKVQFAAIKTIYQDLTSNRCLLVFDHKQKVLPRQFREGQVDYFGKRGMSLLGAMFVRRVDRKIKDEIVSGLEYRYIDCVMEHYSAQDSVQVLSTIKLVIEYLRITYPCINSITLQSDNASCFATHDNIPFVYHLNKDMARNNYHIRIDRWIYTEAQTGKGRLDTHFSYVNTVFDSFVADGNDILTERDIYQALNFQGGILGTTTLLIDGSRISSNNKVLLTKNGFKTKKIGVRETHDIKWGTLSVEVFSLSDITIPEVIDFLKLEEYNINVLDANIIHSNTSPKEPMFTSDQVANKYMDIQHEDDTIEPGSKVEAMVDGLNRCGIEHNNQHTVKVVEKVNGVIKQGWACYPRGTKGEMLSSITLTELKSLYDGGCADKSKKVSADRAHVVITEQTAKRDWYERLICTVARVKAFFAMTPTKMRELISKNSHFESEREKLQNDTAANNVPVVNEIEVASQQLVNTINENDKQNDVDLFHITDVNEIVPTNNNNLVTTAAAEQMQETEQEEQEIEYMTCLQYIKFMDRNKNVTTNDKQTNNDVGDEMHQDDKSMEINENNENESEFY